MRRAARTDANQTAIVEALRGKRTLRIRVDGDPVGQQRPRCVAYRVGLQCRARAYDGHRRPGSKAAERYEAWRGELRLVQFVEGTYELYCAPIELSLLFHLPRPRSHFRTGRNAHLLRADAPGMWDTRRAPHDLSNLTKLVEDEWQGTLFKDDRQVVGYREPFAVVWADASRPGLDAVVTYLDVP